MSDTDISIFPFEVANLLQTNAENNTILAGDAHFVGALVATLREDDDDINRRVAASELGDLLAVAFLPDAVDALLEAIGPDEDTVLRERAIKAIGRIRLPLADRTMVIRAISALATCLEDTRLEIRREALRALGRLSGADLNREILHALLAKLHDLADTVRLAAVVALCPFARDPEVRKALSMVVEEDPAAAVRAEAEAVLQDTRSLAERVSAKFSDLLNQLVPVEQIQESLKGALSSTPALTLKRQFTDRVEKVEDHRGNLGEIVFYVYQTPGTNIRDLTIGTLDEELFDQVILLYFRDEKLEQVAGAKIEDPEGLPCSYLLLRSDSGGAIGKRNLPPNWGDPLLYEVVRPEDIGPEEHVLLLESCKEQKQADRYTAAAWNHWLAQIQPKTLSS